MYSTIRSISSEQQESPNSNLTPILNQNNIERVREMIKRKKESSPFYATSEDLANVITDYDHFPYTRYYRGVYTSSSPIVAEREAGYRPRFDRCYGIKVPPCREAVPYPDHCFQTAGSTVFPCYPEYLDKYGRHDTINIQLNNACINETR